MKEIKKLIEDIYNTDIIAKIVEIGAGLPISSEIFKYAGASKTIYTVESPYSRDAFDRSYAKCTHRAISAEKLRLINDSMQTKVEMDSKFYNTLIASTFQLGDETNKTSTHGWFMLIAKGVTKYYHVSIHQAMSRVEYIEKIGYIGLNLLHNQNQEAFENSYIDIVLNDDLTPNRVETIKYASMCDKADIGIVFSVNGDINRIEVITRDVDSLLVYKGSFNPPTIAHVEIAEESEKIHNSNAIFSISINTYDKGNQDINSLIDRIHMINTLGYDVLLYNKPLFKDMVDFLRNKYNGNVIFPVGVDTMNRLVEPYSDVVKFKEDFTNVEFVCNKRDSYTMNVFSSYLVDQDIVKLYDIKNSSISSTMVRNGSQEEVDKYVPSKIKHLIKNKNK